MKRSDVLVIGLLAAAMSASTPAAAQDRYPLRPVRLVIPSVPAGVHDVIGRVWAERVKPQFGAIVIDNRGGGAGSIGANDVAHSAPDGYSILLGSTTTHVLVPPVMANPPVGAGAHACGVDRLRQGQSGQAVLWVGRHRLDHPYRR